MAIKDFTNLFPGAPNTKTNMPDVVNKTDRVRASHVNKLVDAHLEVETLIGDDSLPAGSLRKRVSDLESAGVVAHASNHTDGTDNIAVATSSTVGLCPILDGSSTKYLNGLGIWSVPPGDGGISTIEAASDTPTGYGSTSGLILESNGVDSFTFKAFTHDLGGSDHSSDTLANLNSKISDATLDDSSSSRTPSGSASGQLGGSYPNPDVRGLRETNGPTLLTIGSITDGQYLKRSGSTLIGASTTGGGSGGILNTKGDILYHDGSSETRLPIGTAGQIIKSIADEGGPTLAWEDGPTELTNLDDFPNSYNDHAYSSLRVDSSETSIEFIKNNLTASIDPTVNDDVDLGYVVGSQWFNTTDDKWGICLSNTNGFAKWLIPLVENWGSNYTGDNDPSSTDYLLYQDSGDSSLKYMQVEHLKKAIPQPTTTYNGLCPALPATGGTTKFLRGDNTWVVPSGSSSTLEGLSDTPSGYGSNGQILETNGSNAFTYRNFAHQASHVTGSDQIPTISNGNRGLCPAGDGSALSFVAGDGTLTSTSAGNSLVHVCSDGTNYDVTQTVYASGEKQFEYMLPNLSVPSTWIFTVRISVSVGTSTCYCYVEVTDLTNIDSYEFSTSSTTYVNMQHTQAVTCGDAELLYVTMYLKSSDGGNVQCAYWGVHSLLNNYLVLS